jgi:hypothetical protein
VLGDIGQYFEEWHLKSFQKGVDIRWVFHSATRAKKEDYS